MMTAILILPHPPRTHPPCPLPPSHPARPPTHPPPRAGVLQCAVLVFFMQCGFALLEAGTVRIKNTKNILLKNGEAVRTGRLGAFRQ